MAIDKWAIKHKPSPPLKAAQDRLKAIWKTQQVARRTGDHDKLAALDIAEREALREIDRLWAIEPNKQDYQTPVLDSERRRTTKVA